MQANNDDIDVLRSQVVSLEEKNERLSKSLVSARERIQELNEQLTGLSRPPASFATFLHARMDDHSIDAFVGNRKMNIAASSALDISMLKPGRELRLNEELVAVGVAGYEDTGQIVSIEMLLGDGRVLVKIHPEDSRIMRIAGSLDGQALNVGDSVLADMRTSFVLEKIERPDVERLMLEEIPDVSYEDIGGLAPQIGYIKDSIELPFERPELYREHGLKPPKGILLYGPPGCGKTLIAKAVATSLARSVASKRHDNKATSFFLNIKGPQLLDKYVGETERQIREIFARARDRASRGIPVVIFFDEMEALFRTRGSGISSDVETTVVPQLLTEIDGVESLENVIIIGASNREDMIDPAILRPGRLDVKIRIDRPSYEASLDIASIYLTDNLPLHSDDIAEHGSIDATLTHMRTTLVDTLFARTPDNEYIEVTYANGTREKLYIADFVSGAMIAGIIDRAKRYAIKDFLATGDKGIRTAHIVQAVADERQENEELNAITSPDDWARVNGRSYGMKVTAVKPLIVADTATQARPHDTATHTKNPPSDNQKPWEGTVTGGLI